MEKDKNTQAKVDSGNPFLEARQDFRKNEKQFRFEECGEYKGIVFINDAASLSLGNTIVSLERLTSPAILITGSATGNTEYDGLKYSIRDKVKAVIYLGKEQEGILRALIGKQILFVSAEGMEQALDYAVKFARPGDTVIYSTAGGEGQGLAFRKAVEKITGKEQG